MMSQRKEFYRNVIMQDAERMLSLEDRNLCSSTRGCFDRAYWHYKTLSDFPSATYQQPLLGLALLYTNNFEGNSYYKNKNLFSWIEAGLLWWKKIQHKDGSFDEWFLYERSFCATAFTAWSVAETVLLLKDELSQESLSLLIEGLCRAGDWLSKNNNSLASNQMLAAILALRGIWQLTKNERYKEALIEKKKLLFLKQDSEGWFPEYGGVDFGYSFLQLDLLAYYYEKTQDSEAVAVANKLIDFMHWFVGPDGKIGPELGSRNTQHIFFYGLEKFSSQNKKAANMLYRILGGYKGHLSTMGLILDDKYTAYFYFNSLVFYTLQMNDEKALEDSEKVAEGYTQVFNHAKLCVIKGNNYFCVVSGFWNGVMRLYHAGRLTHIHGGYNACLRGRRVSNLAQVSVANISANSQHTVEITGKNEFVFLENNQLIHSIFLCFKLFSHAFLRIPFISRVFTRWLKSKRIYCLKKAGIFAERNIVISDKGIFIKDVLSNKTRSSLDEIVRGLHGFALHSPSASFFSKHELLVPLAGITWPLTLKRGESLEIKTDILLGNAIEIHETVSRG